MPCYSIGLDLGTNSLRALVVDCTNGQEISHFVHQFSRGDQGVIVSDTDPNVARQSPDDYFEGVVAGINGALASAEDSCSDFNRSQVVGIGVDTTGSSPMPTDSQGKPLGSTDKWRDHPAAQCWLWKDHTSYAEAEEITAKSSEQGRPYLDYCGGAYSSEWFWSKILHCARTAPEVFDDSYSWIELQDLIPAFLTGTLTQPARGICAAGHKAMFNDQWGGLPSDDFLATLDPKLVQLKARLYSSTQTADQKAGRLSMDLAETFGLKPSIVVATGLMDAHAGAVGSGVQPGTLVKIMGTSTCDLMVGGASTPQIQGVCGVVPGSILPNLIGIEAGQSAVGDLFEWVARHLASGMSHQELNEKARALRPGESGLLALDWNNGNRTILVDPRLSGLIVGQSLHTTLAEIYRAMIEATAFGALMIIQQIESHGVAINRIVTGGGIAEKSPLTMQIYADVCNRPIEITASNQTCALGAAIFGAVVGRAHETVGEAVGAMSSPISKTYTPNPESVATYQRLFAIYRKLHDSFGRAGTVTSHFEIMKELIKIRTEVRAK